jgi:hypothetical protein
MLEFKLDIEITLHQNRGYCKTFLPADSVATAQWWPLLAGIGLQAKATPMQNICLQLYMNIV